MEENEVIADLVHLEQSQRSLLRIRLIGIAQYAQAVADNLDSVNTDAIASSIDASREIQALKQTETQLRVARNMVDCLNWHAEQK
jgi:hypothetical protein